MFHNTYIVDGKIAYGKTEDGIEYIVDSDCVPMLNDYCVYKDKDCNCFYARQYNGGSSVYSLTRLILNIGKEEKRKVKRINVNINDFRRSNLWIGNKYTLVDNYYIVECWNGKTFKIDKEDYELVSKYTWHVDKNNYVITDREYGKKAIKLHRLIFDIIDKPELEVDHIYHDTCDNRKQNMRVCTRSQNVHNIMRNHKNKWGCPGVEQVRGYENMWKVTMTINNERKYFGCFNTLEDAIAMRLRAEKEYGILRVC